MKGKVITTHKTGFPNPLRLDTGEEISVEDRKTEWPGWIWGTTSDGKSGWIPESYVDRKRSKAVLNRDYNATELTVNIGDILEILGEESGWLWCRIVNGDIGWIPKENVRMCD